MDAQGSLLLLSVMTEGPPRNIDLKVAAVVDVFGWEMVEIEESKPTRRSRKHEAQKPVSGSSG